MLAILVGSGSVLSTFMLTILFTFPSLLDSSACALVLLYVFLRELWYDGSGSVYVNGLYYLRLFNYLLILYLEQRL